MFRTDISVRTESSSIVRPLEVSFSEVIDEKGKGWARGLLRVIPNRQKVPAQALSFHDRKRNFKTTTETDPLPR